MCSRWCGVCGILAVLLCPIRTSNAAETTSFTYDALGRLITASNAGGPRDGKQTSTAYDPAGNRAGHAVGQPAPTQPNAAIFSVSGPSPVNEGQAAVFTVTKSGTAGSALSVNFATANGTAAAPGDYTSASGTLTFLHWETLKTLSVATVDDGLGEAAEQFAVTLSSPSSGATIGTGSANATINSSAPGNQPPVAVNDNGGNVVVCGSISVNVLQNDTDPEGNYPLVLVAVSSSSLGDASLSATPTNIDFVAYGVPGPTSVTYTVRDSLNAQSQAQLTINVINGFPGCQ